MPEAEPQRGSLRPSRALGAIVSLVGLLTLGGCGDDLSCGSDAAKETVLNITKSQYGNAMNIEESEFKIEDIRTVNKDSVKSICLANLKYKYSYSDETKSAPYFAVATSLTYGAPGEWQTRPIKYDLQITDGGKLYANVWGLTGDAPQ